MLNQMFHNPYDLLQNFRSGPPRFCYQTSFQCNFSILTNDTILDCCSSNVNAYIFLHFISSFTFLSNPICILNQTLFSLKSNTRLIYWSRALLLTSIPIGNIVCILSYYKYFFFASQIICAASFTISMSSSTSAGRGSLTPPSSSPSLIFRIALITAYIFPYAEHIL